MEETWKDIQDFPGYQVSDMGRIRSHGKITSSARFRVRRWKDRIIKPKKRPRSLKFERKTASKAEKV